MSWRERHLLGAEAVPAMHDGDVRRDVRQVQRFFDRSVSSADDRDGLSPEEEPVAGRAGGDATALVGFFGGEPQISSGCAGGNDQRVAGVGPAVAAEKEGACAGFGFVDGIGDDFGLESFGVAAHAFHQVGTEHAGLVARPVVDVSGGGHLAADLEPGDQHRSEIGAGSIDRSGVSRRPRPEYQQLGVSPFAHRPPSNRLNPHAVVERRKPLSPLGRTIAGVPRILGFRMPLKPF